ARAPRRGPGKEVTYARALRAAAVRPLEVQRKRARRKAVERGADILVGGVHSLQEKAFDRSGSLEHLPQDPEERDQVFAANPSVDHLAHRRGGGLRLESTHELRRTWADNTQQIVDGVQNAGDAAEGKSAGTERGNLAVRRLREGPGLVHRVARRINP